MLQCVICVDAFEANLLTGGYTEPVEGVTDRPLLASVVYDGQSLCSRHHNSKRGLPADFVRYPL